jgi:hypothetical protein
MLYSLLQMKSKINQDTAIIIYKACIRPLLTYGSPSWTNVCKTCMKKLQIIQNKVLRIITNACRYTKISKLHEDLNIPTIKQYIYKRNSSFFNGTLLHDNELAREVSAPVETVYSRKRRPIQATASLKENG